MPDSPPPAAPPPPRKKRWRRLRVALPLLALVLLGIGLYWWRWITTGRFYVVHRGRLYRSAALPPERLKGICRRYRIRAVIDFRDEKDEAQAESAALAEIGARHVHLPSHQVPSPDVVAKFLALMDDPANHPALIHCTHGVGRTGVFAAIYRMEYQGWSNRRARLEALTLAGFESFGKDTAKGQFLLGYVPRSRQRRAEGGAP